jgi:hypothetical protein
VPGGRHLGAMVMSLVISHFMHGNDFLYEILMPSTSSLIASLLADPYTSTSKTRIEDTMWDIVYLLLTVAVFGSLLAYVRACEKLGARGERNSDVR